MVKNVFSRRFFKEVFSGNSAFMYGQYSRASYDGARTVYLIVNAKIHIFSLLCLSTFQFGRSNLKTILKKNIFCPQKYQKKNPPKQLTLGKIQKFSVLARLTKNTKTVTLKAFQSRTGSLDWAIIIKSIQYFTCPVDTLSKESTVCTQEALKNTLDFVTYLLTGVCCLFLIKIALTQHMRQNHCKVPSLSCK